MNHAHNPIDTTPPAGPTLRDRFRDGSLGPHMVVIPSGGIPDGFTP
uniref:Uncharacterized protein n=1 Tax=Candidatus Kentrum sp. LFY TaxID=2126342 RepID=A0A450U9J3_9GAMM|nr:MAG: hypothetical protein BECKLFY1418A_GA0070994_100544 [Candidatus Kentron sp. LFY]